MNNMIHIRESAGTIMKNEWFYAEKNNKKIDFYWLNTVNTHYYHE